MPHHDDGSYYLKTYNYKETRCQVCGMKFHDCDRKTWKSYYYRMHTETHNADAVDRASKRRKWGYP